MPHPNEDALLILRNDHVVVGLLTDVGGRVVLLRRPDGDNVLKSDPALWCEPDSQRARPAADAGWKEYNGHITWLGPQSGFWTDQNIAPNRRKAGWPPDPWLIYGSYETVDLSADAVTLASPDSPVSGVRMTKTVRIEPDGTVHVSATIENVRDRAVSWDVWSNTRMEGASRCYVPLGPEGALRLEFATRSPVRHRMTPHEVVDGWFTFDSGYRMPDGATGATAKAFMYPAQGLIAGFAPRDVFLKRFQPPPADAVHPEQAAVEIYQALSREPGRGLLELEAHGPFVTLQPGETTSFAETWRVLPWVGGGAPAEHVAFLNTL